MIKLNEQIYRETETTETIPSLDLDLRYAHGISKVSYLSPTKAGHMPRFIIEYYETSKFLPFCL